MLQIVPLFVPNEIVHPVAWLDQFGKLVSSPHRKLGLFAGIRVEFKRQKCEKDTCWLVKRRICVLRRDGPQTERHSYTKWWHWRANKNINRSTIINSSRSGIQHSLKRRDESKGAPAEKHYKHVFPVSYVTHFHRTDAIVDWLATLAPLHQLWAHRQNPPYLYIG